MIKIKFNNVTDNLKEANLTLEAAECKSDCLDCLVGLENGQIATAGSAELLSLWPGHSANPRVGLNLPILTTEEVGGLATASLVHWKQR